MANENPTGLTGLIDKTILSDVVESIVADYKARLKTTSDEIASLKKRITELESGDFK